MNLLGSYRGNAKYCSKQYLYPEFNFKKYKDTVKQRKDSLGSCYSMKQNSRVEMRRPGIVLCDAIY